MCGWGSNWGAAGEARLVLSMRRQAKHVKDATCAAYLHSFSKSSLEEAALLLDQVREFPRSQCREAGAQVRPSAHFAAAGAEVCQEPDDCQRCCVCRGAVGGYGSEVRKTRSGR